MKHLPATKKEFLETKWDCADFIFVVGEAYVDHPSFGHAIISRVLEDAGYRVAIISLPDWKDVNSFKVYGRPRLGFLVSAGNIDSMVNHYTVTKKKRSNDVYAPDSKAGQRPDRATIVYSNMIRQAYKDAPIIIGGIEASLRRFAHYDYWADKVKRSILEDSSANLLVYGMGELAIVEIANLLNKNVPITSITNIKGTCYLANKLPETGSVLPSFEQVNDDKKIFASCFIQQQRNQDSVIGKTLIQKQHRKFLVQNPPQKTLSQVEFDKVYELPYTRTYHPMYSPKGIASLKEVEFSLLSCRGCFGSCNFCAITFHQGRNVASRSHKSLVNEAKNLTEQKNFKGYIHDVGGPTANFRHLSCAKQETHGVCLNKQCLFPEPCSSLKVDHSDYLTLLRKLRKLQGIKKVFIRSGIRFDYLMADKHNKEFVHELCAHHVSGRLKVAPEHISQKVLNAMGKPTNETFSKFKDLFEKTNEKLKEEQFIEPYFISSHPGSDLDCAIELACTMKKMNISPQQVQDFYPTPSTISTCMYYTGYDPRTMQKIYVPKGEEKKMQRALLQFKDPKNHSLVIKALNKANRQDLIGHSKDCLVRPYKIENKKDIKKGGKSVDKNMSTYGKPKRKKR